MAPFSKTAQEPRPPSSASVPEVTFRIAQPSDDAALRAFLSAAGLPWTDVSAAHQDYLLAHSGQALAGTVGLEVHGPSALLRSLAVAEPLRGRGLGSALFERALAHAALRGVEVLYLLTLTAERFFAARGFERIERSGVPPDVAGSQEFRSLCPASATCMRRRLDSARVPAGNG